MAWGTYTIGGRDIALAKWEAKKAADLRARGGMLPVVIECESVAECIEMGILSGDHFRGADGSVTTGMVADDWNAILTQAHAKEKPGALLLRLLRQNTEEWTKRRAYADKQRELAERRENSAKSPASASELAAIAAEHMRTEKGKAK